MLHQSPTLWKVKSQIHCLLKPQPQKLFSIHLHVSAYPSLPWSYYQTSNTCFRQSYSFLWVPSGSIPSSNKKNSMVSQSYHLSPPSESGLYRFSRRRPPCQKISHLCCWDRCSEAVFCLGPCRSLSSNSALQIWGFYCPQQTNDGHVQI